mgnify:FL=1
MSELTITPGFYKHWKGQIYYVIEVHIRRDIAPFVVYSACYGDNSLYTRPVSEWFDVMGQKENGEPLYRFEKIKYEVAEVRHGEWIETDYFDAHKAPVYKCSVCFREVADYYIKCHKYCLHCGAKMYGEKNGK